MSDDIAMSDASAPSIHDASKPVAMEDLIRDKTCDLRTFLHKYHAINASRIGRLADELKYLGLTGPVGEHLKIIKAHRAFGKMIDEEQREVDRRGELVRYVAYCQVSCFLFFNLWYGNIEHDADVSLGCQATS